MRPAHRPVDDLDRHFLEDDARDVLGPVDVADPRVPGHNHRARPFASREPWALGTRDGAVAVVEDVLAQVPHRAVVGLRVPIERDLFEPPAAERHVLGDQHPNTTSAPTHPSTDGEEGRLRSKGLALHATEQHRRPKSADREERVVDPRWVRERGRTEIDPLAHWRATSTAVGPAVGRRCTSCDSGAECCRQHEPREHHLRRRCGHRSSSPSNASGP